MLSFLFCKNQDYFKEFVNYSYFFIHCQNFSFWKMFFSHFNMLQQTGYVLNSVKSSILHIVLRHSQVETLC